MAKRLLRLPPWARTTSHRSIRKAARAANRWPVVCMWGRSVSRSRTSKSASTPMCRNAPSRRRAAMPAPPAPSLVLSRSVLIYPAKVSIFFHRYDFCGLILVLLRHESLSGPACSRRSVPRVISVRPNVKTRRGRFAFRRKMSYLCSSPQGGSRASAASSFALSPPRAGWRAFSAKSGSR